MYFDYYDKNMNGQWKNNDIHNNIKYTYMYIYTCTCINYTFINYKPVQIVL